jgi:hypothetical protein
MRNLLIAFIGISRRHQPGRGARRHVAANDKCHREAGGCADGGEAADERRNERHELRHDGLRLTGYAES